jgi:hypothetical protein
LSEAGLNQMEPVSEINHQVYPAKPSE